MNEFLPNSNHSLRLISARMVTGDVVIVDQAILGFYVTYGTPPAPVVYGGVPPKAEATFLHDKGARTWSTAQGDVYHSWADAVAPLLRAWDLKQAREQLKLSPPPAPTPAPTPPPIKPKLASVKRPKPF